jgi:hypothetical protein
MWGRTDERQSVSTFQNKLQTATTLARFLVEYNIATYNKPFSDNEFVRQFMVDVAKAVCPEIRTASAFTFIQKNNCKSHRRRNEQSVASTDDNFRHKQHSSITNT